MFWLGFPVVVLPVLVLIKKSKRVLAFFVGWLEIKKSKQASACLLLLATCENIRKRVMRLGLGIVYLAP